MERLSRLAPRSRCAHWLSWRTTMQLRVNPRGETIDRAEDVARCDREKRDGRERRARGLAARRLWQ